MQDISVQDKCFLRAIRVDGCTRHLWFGRYVAVSPGKHNIVLVTQKGEEFKDNVDVPAAENYWYVSCMPLRLSIYQ